MPSESTLLAIVAGVIGITTSIISKVRCYFKSSVDPCIISCSDVKIQSNEDKSNVIAL